MPPTDPQPIKDDQPSVFTPDQTPQTPLVSPESPPVTPPLTPVVPLPEPIVTPTEPMPAATPGAAIVPTGKQPRISKKKLLIIGACCVVVLCAAAVSYFLLQPHKKASSPATKTNAAAISRSKLGLPPTVAKSAVNIKLVTIKTDVQEQKNSQTDFAAVANGHYAYIDGSSNGKVDAASGGKVIYDGTVITQSSQVIQDNVVLSRNGLHYGYYTDDGTNYNMYVDNKLVNSISDANTLTFDGISNDGLHIAYTSQDNAGNDVIYKDKGTNFFTSTGSFGYAANTYNTVLFNTDLSKYIGLQSAAASLNNTNVLTTPNNEPVFNNQPLTSQKFYNYTYNMGISDDGLHYYVVGDNSVKPTPTTITPQTTVPPNTTQRTGPSTTIPNYNQNGTAAPVKTTAAQIATPATTITNTFLVDAKVVATIADMNTAGINSAGDYCYIKAGTSPTFVIDNKYSYTLPATDFNTSDTNTGNNIFTALNSDNSHFVVGNSDTGYWIIDGQKTSAITGDTYATEFNGNTLYIYNWSN